MVFTVVPRLQTWIPHMLWLPNRNLSTRGCWSHCLAAKTCSSWWNGFLLGHIRSVTYNVISEFGLLILRVTKIVYTRNAMTLHTTKILTLALSAFIIKAPLPTVCSNIGTTVAG
jgi:hypothetical protein